MVGKDELSILDFLVSTGTGRVNLHYSSFINKNWKAVSLSYSQEEQKTLQDFLSSNIYCHFLTKEFAQKLLSS